MNKEKLISLINNPTNISNEDLEALKKLADEYPYFQIAHTLIAKTLGDNKSLAFKNRLHYASITSPDRNILKKVIEGHAISYATSTAVDAPVKEEIKETAPPKEEIKKEEVKEVENSADIVKERLAEIEGTKVKENLSDLAVPAAVASASTLKITDKATDNKLINELEENLKSLQKAKEKNVAEAKTIQTAKTAVKAKPVRKKVTLTKKKVTTAKKATPKKTAVKKAVKSKTPIKKVTTRKTAANTKRTPVKKTTTKKAASSKKITPKKVGVKKAPVRKVAAIKKVAPVKAKTKKVVAKKVTIAKKATPIKATAKKIASKKATTTRAKTTAAKKKIPKKVSETTTVTAQSKIIDAFIKKEPKIRPKKPSLKVKEKPQKDLSVESTKIKNDLVSENLAIIMEKQGKISKAKDIYKKLIWKFPQKKAYFATRIKELDKK